MKKAHNPQMPDQAIKDSIDNTADAPLHYYCLSFMYAEKDAKGSIYVGLMEEKVTTRVITNAKNKMLKHYKNADPNTAVLISASYLGFMKPSEFGPNWLGGLLE